jgi:hypothetical protein
MYAMSNYLERSRIAGEAEGQKKCKKKNTNDSSLGSSGLAIVDGHGLGHKLKEAVAQFERYTG